MNEKSILQRPAQTSKGQLDQLRDLCRRAGLPPVSVSDRCAQAILVDGQQEDLRLYDLVWSVRTATKRQAPCAITCQGSTEIFHVEFWSLGTDAEPELQRIDAALTTLHDGKTRLLLSLPGESAALP